MWQNIISIASLLILANFASSFPQNVHIEKQRIVQMPSEEINTKEYLKELPINEKDAELLTEDILNKIKKINVELLNDAEETTVTIIDNDIETTTFIDESTTLEATEPNIDCDSSTEVDTLKHTEITNELPQEIKQKVIKDVNYFAPALKPSYTIQELPLYQVPNRYHIHTYYSNINRNGLPKPYYLHKKYPVPIVLNPVPNMMYQNYPINRQWPLQFSQYFPMMFRDQLITLVNGITDMVRYNPFVFNKRSRKINNKIIPFMSDNRFGKNVEVLPIKNIGNTAEDLKTEKKSLFGYPNSNALNFTEEGDSKVLDFVLKPPSASSQNLESDIPDNKLFRIANRRPDAVSNPGFFIKRLRVRQGGVAIAGPGGIATAGGGGTAIVGPDGVAYTKPNGVAIAGPGAKIISLPEDFDLNRLIEKLSKHQITDPEIDGVDQREIKGEYVYKDENSTFKKIFVPEGGKIVATGPSIYRNPSNTDIQLI